MKKLGVAFLVGCYLLLMFTGTQLWGTGLYTEQQQDNLREEFELKLQTQVTVPSTQPSTTTATEESPVSTQPPVVEENPFAQIATDDAVAKIIVPKAGIDHIVVAGANSSSLKKGPGHDSNTPYPGQLGNVVVVGHRTSYAAPFENLDVLVVGDVITIQTLVGVFEYKVTEVFEVYPDEYMRVVSSQPDPTLTLVTCTPKYTTQKRLVVRSTLVRPEQAEELLEVSTVPTEEPVAPEEFPEDRVIDLLEEDGKDGFSAEKALTKDVLTKLVIGVSGSLLLVLGGTIFRKKLGWVAVGLLIHLPVFFAMLGVVELTGS